MPTISAKETKLMHSRSCSKEMPMVGDSGKLGKKRRALDRIRTDEVPIVRSCAPLPITFFFL